MDTITFLPLLLLFILLMMKNSQGKKKLIMDIWKKRRERRSNVMPVEFLKEFIGQVCQITVFDGNAAVAMLLGVEGNWLKIEENGQNKLVNGDHVRSIVAMPEKYQEKYQEKARRKQGWQRPM